MTATLHYVYDPMCSWCYAYAPVWQRVQSALGDSLPIRYVLGGLATDSEAPMPVAMQQQLQATWQRIEQQVAGTRFNYRFWQDCQPRRSTWRACRAALLARDAGLERDMLTAIQQAYYQQARNPSDTDTLSDCAAALGLDRDAFAAALDSDAVRLRLLQELQFARHIGGDSFPSLILVADGGEPRPVALDYNNAERQLQSIRQQLP